MLGILIAIGVIAIIGLFMTIKVVPQQEAWIIERFGRFEKAFKEFYNRESIYGFGDSQVKHLYDKIMHLH